MSTPAQHIPASEPERRRPAARPGVWIWLALGLAAGSAFAISLFRPHASPPVSAAQAVWLDLADEHRFADTYYLPEYQLDFSAPDQVRWLDHRWEGIDPAARVLPSRGPVAALRISSIAVPALLELDIEPTWARNAEDHRVEVRVNGTPLPSFPAPGRTRQTLRIADTMLRNGENQIEIACPDAKRFQLSAFRVVPLAPPSPAPWLPSGSVVESGAGGSKRILQLPGAGLSFYVKPPPGASVRFGVPAKAGPAEVVYRVVLETVTGSHESIFEARPGQTGQEAVLALPDHDGAPVRLSFAIEAASEDAGDTPFAWEAPRITSVAQPPPDRAPAPYVAADPPPNIVLYVIDTLRADHLQPYGYERATSPAISRLAEDAVVFDRAHAHSVWTKPSVGSLMTGRLPYEHLATNDVGHLNAALPLLSTYLKRRGYTCLGLQANGNVGRDFGFARDFDLFVDGNDLFAGRRYNKSDSSELLHAELLRDLDRLREPFFLFIQSLDPHDPYDPQGEYRQFVNGHPLEGQSSREMFELIKTLHDTSTERHRQVVSYLVGLYDGEIRHNDYYFGQLIDLLKAKGLYDRTAILVTADHGEGFHDHGYEVAHAAFFEHTVRVPLIFKPPFGHAPGRSAVPVQLIDIAPTVLQLAGLRDDALPGRSLIGTLEDGSSLGDRPTYQVRYRDQVERRFKWDGRGVIVWPWKLIHDNLWQPRYEIYDLARDPLELGNHWHPGLAEPRVLLGYLLEQQRRFPFELATPAAPPQPISDSVREQLRQLGYAD